MLKLFSALLRSVLQCKPLPFFSFAGNFLLKFPYFTNSSIFLRQFLHFNALLQAFLVHFWSETFYFQAVFRALQPVGGENLRQKTVSVFYKIQLKKLNYLDRKFYQKLYQRSGAKILPSVLKSHSTNVSFDFFLQILSHSFIVLSKESLVAVTVGVLYIHTAHSK